MKKLVLVLGLVLGLNVLAGTTTEEKSNEFVTKGLKTVLGTIIEEKVVNKDAEAFVKESIVGALEKTSNADEVAAFMEKLTNILK